MNVALSTLRRAKCAYSPADNMPPGRTPYLDALAEHIQKGAEPPTLDDLNEYYASMPTGANKAADGLLQELYGRAYYWGIVDSGNIQGLTVIGKIKMGNQNAYSMVEASQAHYDWVRARPQPEHPLTPLVAAWLTRPRPVKHNERGDPLFPASIMMLSDDDPRRERLGFTLPARVSPEGDYLPGLAPGEIAAEPTTPALPLQLYDLGQGPARTPGKGAPLALRIFVDTMIATKPTDRDLKDGRPLLLPPVRLRQYLHHLYPSTNSWRKGRHLRAFLDALDAVHNCRIAYTLPDGSGVARNIVTVVDRPVRGLDDWVRFFVNLPPKSARGFMTDRKALVTSGANHAIAYRLFLSLSAHWNQPGTMRVPLPGRGRRRRTWAQTQTPDRYPEVDDELLIAMAFPAGRYSRRRDMLAKATKALAYLAAHGWITVHLKRRIMPGPEWAGWGNNT